MGLGIREVGDNMTIDSPEAATMALDKIADDFVSGRISEDDAQGLVAEVCTSAPPAAVRVLDLYYDRKVADLKGIRT